MTKTGFTVEATTMATVVRMMVWDWDTRLGTIHNTSKAEMYQDHVETVHQKCTAAVL